MATVSESAETRPHAPAAISTDRTVWAAVALTVLAAGLRLPGLGAQSYWFDESVTVWLTHFSLPGMLAVIPANESTPPLYYVLAWLWSHLWGTGEAGLRSLSALAGVATVPVAYATARRLWSGRAALIAAALTACNPLLIWYSQEARAYSLVVLLTAGCLLAGAHLRDRVDRGWAATWVACAGLALATHYFALLVVVPQWLWLAIRYRRDRRMRIALELVVAVALLLAPLAAAQLAGQQGAHSWMRSVSLAHRIADVPRTFALGPAAPAARWLGAAIAVATGIAGWLAWTRTSRRERAGIGLLLGLAAAATVIVALLIAAGYDELDYRNMLVVWLPCALALAGGLGARRAGRVGVTAALVICAVGVGTAVAVRADPALQRPAWRSVAAVLRADRARAVVIVDGCQRLPLALYLPGLSAAPGTGVQTTEVDLVSAAGQRTWTDVLESGWYVQCEPTPPGARLPASLGAFRRLGPAVHVNQFTITRMVAAVPARVTLAALAGAGVRGELLRSGL